MGQFRKKRLRRGGTWETKRESKRDKNAEPNGLKSSGGDRGGNVGYIVGKDGGKKVYLKGAKRKRQDERLKQREGSQNCSIERGKKKGD